MRSTIVRLRMCDIGEKMEDLLSILFLIIAGIVVYYVLGKWLFLFPLNRAKEKNVSKNIFIIIQSLLWYSLLTPIMD